MPVTWTGRPCHTPSTLSGNTANGALSGVCVLIREHRGSPCFGSARPFTLPVPRAHQGGVPGLSASSHRLSPSSTLSTRGSPPKTTAHPPRPCEPTTRDDRARLSELDPHEEQLNPDVRRDIPVRQATRCTNRDPPDIRNRGRQRRKVPTDNLPRSFKFDDPLGTIQTGPCSIFWA